MSNGNKVEKPSKKNVAKRCRGMKFSELTDQDKGWLFHKRMSTGEISTVIACNKLVDDREDYLKRYGKVVAPEKGTDARYDKLVADAAKKAK